MYVENYLNKEVRGWQFQRGCCGSPHWMSPWWWGATRRRAALCSNKLRLSEINYEQLIRVMKFIKDASTWKVTNSGESKLCLRQKMKTAIVMYARKNTNAFLRDGERLVIYLPRQEVGRCGVVEGCD